MKQFWFGLGLLAVMLVAGIWVTGKMKQTHKPASDRLRQASQYALEADWENAHRMTMKARKNWEDHRHLTASVVNHEPMDEIDALFSQLEIYGRCRDGISYSATCARLAELLDALYQEQQFYWWNLL